MKYQMKESYYAKSQKGEDLGVPRMRMRFSDAKTVPQSKFGASLPLKISHLGGPQASNTGSMSK